MEFIKINTEADKTKYITRFAEKQKNKHNYNINCLKAEQSTPSDYAEEIKEEAENLRLYVDLLAVADDIQAVKIYCKSTIKSLYDDIMKLRFEDFLKIAEAETNTEIFIERIDF